ncbi:hypothetical protein [Leptospira interrogans]|uniref:hypothetical protein n=1 Tax=Leptospira interrogans TaxID=173 RepID=UPI003C12FDF8
MFYGDFVSNFFSLDSILFALFDILTLFQGRLITINFVAKSRFSVKYLILNSIVLSKNERYFLKI